MLEKWKNVVFKRKVFRILLTDLSKAFDCISQQLLVAESHAYDLSLLTSKMISNCLLNCKMRTMLALLVLPGKKLLGAP